MDAPLRPIHARLRFYAPLAITFRRCHTPSHRHPRLREVMVTGYEQDWANRLGVGIESLTNCGV